jgi:UDP-N-acetylmuramoyl-tripeptide--D-alanyl-D-alanine ligase
LNDAYNASPASTRAAIRLLEALDGYNRKFVVLGDMLELGIQEVEYHRQIGYELNPDRIDVVFTYGKLAAQIADAAKDAYCGKLLYTYDDKLELIAMLKSLIQPGDIVLVKGSRGMRMEEVIQALLKGNDYD